MNTNRIYDSSFATKMILSFSAIYLIWGTTYLAMRVAVHSLPPFLMASSRFLFAGMILYSFLRFRGIPNPTFAQWKSALIVGVLLFLGGNGLVTWAEQEIPSGIAALVIATLPMWMTLFDWLFFRGPKPSFRVGVGLMMGLAGIVLLIGPAQIFSGESVLNLKYMTGLIFAPIFWSIGSLYCRNADLPESVFMASAAEMLCGGVVLILVSLFFGEPFFFEPAEVPIKAWLCLSYLTIFGSMIALCAYAWLLQNVNASKVATYSYVNPIIAVFLGWLILNESVSWQTATAVVVIVSGVVMIVTDKNKKAKALTTVSVDEAPASMGECLKPCEVGR